MFNGTGLLKFGIFGVLLSTDGRRISALLNKLPVGDARLQGWHESVSSLNKSGFVLGKKTALYPCYISRRIIH